MPDLVRNGTIVLPDDPAAREDARNAAQAVIIGYIERDLMEHFRRPKLDSEKSVYPEFCDKYADASREQEFEIWEKIGREVEASTKAHPESPLDERAAAYLTLQFLEYDGPPRSEELYMSLPLFAEAYEKKLKEKYGDAYAHERLYEGMRKSFPAFLTRYIGMNSIISILATTNLATKETFDKSSPPLRPDVIFEPRMLRLKDDDSLVFSETFVDIIHEHAQRKNYKEDQVGRTEDRGCPVLFSEERDAILAFSIEEMIAQHKMASITARP
jgi:hypothetical protein